MLSEWNKPLPYPTAEYPHVDRKDCLSTKRLPEIKLLIYQNLTLTPQNLTLTLTQTLYHDGLQSELSICCRISVEVNTCQRIVIDPLHTSLKSRYVPSWQSKVLPTKELSVILPTKPMLSIAGPPPSPDLLSTNEQLSKNVLPPSLKAPPTSAVLPMKIVLEM